MPQHRGKNTHECIPRALKEWKTTHTQTHTDTHTHTLTHTDTHTHTQTRARARRPIQNHKGEQEQQTLRRLIFKCKVTRMALVMSTHQPHKAYCAGSF